MGRTPDDLYGGITSAELLELVDSAMDPVNSGEVRNNAGVLKAVDSTGLHRLRPTRDYSFAFNGRVPANGRRIGTMDGSPLSSTPIIAPFDGIVGSVALRSNAADSSRDYDVRFTKNGPTVIETVTFPALTKNKQVDGLGGTAFAQGDRLRVYLERTSGTGRSTFTRFLGTFSLVEAG